MVFCNVIYMKVEIIVYEVTILILIDGFLQYDTDTLGDNKELCHNPYFNRWFSAII